MRRWEYRNDTTDAESSTLGTTDIAKLELKPVGNAYAESNTTTGTSVVTGA
jgi:hypothetical protein